MEFHLMAKGTAVKIVNMDDQKNMSDCMNNGYRIIGQLKAEDGYDSRALTDGIAYDYIDKIRQARELIDAVCNMSGGSSDPTMTTIHNLTKGE